jgi:hypothetical protein
LSGPECGQYFFRGSDFDGEELHLLDDGSIETMRQDVTIILDEKLIFSTVLDLECLDGKLKKTGNGCVNLGNVCQQILLLFLCLQSVQMNFYY